MKLLGYILRLSLGGIFIFSGIVKLIDPIGTEIKLEEYFDSFAVLSDHFIVEGVGGLFIFLKSFALYLSVILSTLEVVLGIGLIVWWKPKMILWTTIGLLIFFGFLTGYSANCDPNNPYGVSCVTDCGCFGDFMKLKPINSFYKDLTLLLLALPLLFFLNKKSQGSLFSNKGKWMMIGGILVCVVFAFWNIKNLPIVDFRPYEIGNDIITLRKNSTPPKMLYHMSKDGKEYAFEKYPTENGYTLVNAEQIEEGTESTVKDFYLYDYESGDDVTEEVLSGDYIYFITKNILDIDDKSLMLEFQQAVKNTLPKTKVILISGNSEEEVKSILDLGEINHYNLDETVIKAMIRSNPGVIHIKKGEVQGKWTLSNYLKSMK